MPGTKYLGVMTRGVAELAKDHPGLLDRLAQAFAEESAKSEDWFYELEVDGQRFFAADNGERGYTVMLPEEY